MSQPAYDSSYGSVADEAARLIGLFKGLSEAEAQAAGERVAAGGDRASATAGGGPKGGFGPPAEHTCPECGQTTSAAPGGSRSHASEGTSMPPTCRSCPVCMLITAAKSVSPETIERLADVVDMIGDGLRGFAESRRAAKTR